MKILSLKFHQLELLFSYASSEGWDIEEAHMLALFKSHPNDFFIIYKSSELIGFIIAIKYSNEFGFISSFLVLPEFRGLGYGKVIFEFALKHLQGCQIALDSVVGKEELYEDAGFKSYFDVITYKYITKTKEPRYTKIFTTDYKEGLTHLVNSSYINAMITDERVNYKVILRENHISSCAFSFPYKDGFKIHIESNDIQEIISLFFTLTNKFKTNTAIYLQTTKLSPLLFSLTKELQMSEESKSIRMYNKILD